MLAASLTDSLNRLTSGVENSKFAVAFSGGGDSTALLHAIAGHPDCAAVYIVDHGLRAESRQEAELTQSRADAAGFKAQILTWTPGRVTNGLQEKARKARYALMGQACRENDIPFLVTGHTRDDQAETLIMRYERGTDWRGAAGMAEATFAPLWPELAGVTVLRPALNVKREDLRAYNREHKLEWIEDPSNENTDFKRIEIRRYLKSREGLADDLIAAANDLRRGRDAELRHLAGISDLMIDYLGRGDIQLAGPVPAQLLTFCIQAVAGSGEPLRPRRVARLCAAMRTPGFKGATLGGAQIKPNADGFHVFRDAGAVLGRSGDPSIPEMNIADAPFLWDGRFWIESGLTDGRVVPFWSHRNSLTRRQNLKVGSLNPAVLKTVPAVIQGENVAAIAYGMFNHKVTMTSLVQSHLQGRLSGVDTFRIWNEKCRASDLPF